MNRELLRWGLLLDVLSQMSDVERQVVAQGTKPGSFIPDELVDSWSITFRSGQGLRTVGVSDIMLSLLIEFDYYLDELIDMMPDVIDDPEFYIRHDEAWGTVREMADWTLSRIASLGIPDNPDFSEN